MARLALYLIPALFSSIVLARTVLTGCTSTNLDSPAGASVAWYVPGTGELCDFLDCGGGAGAPRTDVPGCPLYSGTSTYSPSYLPGYSHATAGASGSVTTTALSTEATTTAVVGSTASTIPNSYNGTTLASASAPRTGTLGVTSITASSTPSGTRMNATANGATSIATGATTSATVSTGGAVEMASARRCAGLVLGFGVLVAAL